MIERRARNGFSEARVSPAYRRAYVNHTGVTVVVVDGSGVTEYIPPTTAAVNDTDGGSFAVIEEFTDASPRHLSEAGIPYEDIDPMPLRNGGHEGSFHIRHRIRFEDLAESDGGIFDECLGLFIALATDVDTVKHPRFMDDMAGELDRHNALGVMVELLDPKCVWPNFFINLGGEVQVIKPIRHPTPDREGVRITRRDSATGEFIRRVYTVEELVSGAGVYGVRLYRDRWEAQGDVREPEHAAFIKERKQFNEEREVYRKKVEEETRRRVEEEKDAAHRKERAQYEEKLRRLEEERDKRHKEKMKDKTGLFSAAVKTLMSLVDLVRFGLAIVF